MTNDRNLWPCPWAIDPQKRFAPYVSTWNSGGQAAEIAARSATFSALREELSKRRLLLEANRSLTLGGIRG